ncbi:MAG: hypothetical protein CVV04_06035 [Firmicutes bacterium HGW-Firmicutes-9]|jgi:NAD-dependent dihydropyrimidine dehydrogenase PreA subunit|nr:MAG: hypothetical protein CVV04_06035 [Firmicutes bacterium HGW-Firmicutes-9]
MKNASILKIAALHFFMYFIGPVIWGVWMIFRLQIVSVQQYLHCLTSVPVLSMFVIYSVANTVYMGCKAKQATDNLSHNRQRPMNGKFILLFNAIFVVSFGTIGTFAFLSMLSTNSLCFIPIDMGAWYSSAIVGSLSGAALVLMFYNFFSTTVVMSVIEGMRENHEEEYRNNLLTLKREIKLLYHAGVILFFVSAIASLMITKGFEFGHALNQSNFRFMATMVVPLLMGSLMYRKSVRKIKDALGYQRGSGNGRKKPRRKTTILVQFLIQMISLSAFTGLFLTGNGRLWLIPLITGFVLSVLFGRFYCGWLCPAHMFDVLKEKLFRNHPIKKRTVPKWLKSKSAGIMVFLLFLCAFTISMILHLRPQIFLALTLAGMIVSFFYPSVVWCGALCPWGTMFRFLSKITPIKLAIKTEQCAQCGKCRMICPTESIEISTSRCEIDSSSCMRCLNCIKACGMNAVELRAYSTIKRKNTPIVLKESK